MNKEFEDNRKIEFKGLYENLEVSKGDVDKPLLIVNDDSYTVNTFLDKTIISRKKSKEEINVVGGKFVNIVDKIDDISLKDVKLVLPEKSKLENISIRSNITNVSIANIILKKIHIYATSGNIKIVNLLLQELIVNTVSGNIKLEDFNSIITDIKTISGNTYAEIANFIDNYKLKLNSVTGSSCFNYEYIVNNIKKEDYLNKFYANSISGNIKVLFKGF